ncbi:elongation factor G [Phycicoccus sp. CSK15P-2]|uniref:elongation factor G n=1 Tax=Phycicoccus sp. CSK15P-2 TaxID=2807627 RepID=UPI00194EA548|nr:elongation factor G [Phycicoccus sp. CSK15P-2]MBM6403924.1 elongation factor G [Phycicoccus sp. CSK15P-2]
MSGSVAQAPPVHDVSRLRTVVLVGPGGAGTSRLFDHVVGTLSPRRSGSRRTEVSPGLRVATLPLGKVVLTLLDAPGNPDFVGQVRAGLRAADAALFVVSAADGADARSRALWHECALVGMPRAVLVTQLDTRDADFVATLEDCRAHFGGGIQPLGVPVPGVDGAVTSVADLLLGEIHDYSGGERSVRAAGPEHAEVFDTHRPGLVEGIIEESEDPDLMERYLAGDALDLPTLEGDLLAAVSRGAFHPVLPVSGETGAGVDVVLHLVEAALPHPGLHPLPTVTPVGGGDPVELAADPDGPLVAEVVHTESDAYVGHLSLVRVFSGTLRADRPVHVSGHLELLDGPTGEGHEAHDDDVRPGSVAAPLDGELMAKDHAVAGEVVVVTKLTGAQTSDTLSDPSRPLLVTPWALPDALLPAAVRAASRADEDRMPVAFRELAAEDPSLRIDHDGDTGQVVLWTTGPAHLDLVLHRMRDRFNVGVEQVPVTVALKETATGRCEAQGRHVKQSGGHGQYAVCHLVLEPLPRGSGVRFDEVVVGGAVPRQFIGSVEKGVHAQLAKGLLAGWPVTDVQVTLTDGKAHSVDSSDMAFQTAAGLALRELASPATLCLLEPIDTVHVTVDDEHLGAVMTDVSTRRGQILGSEPAPEPGRSVLTAAVPRLELLDYAVALRSLAHGTGTFHREPRGYEELPERIAREHLGARATVP